MRRSRLAALVAVVSAVGLAGFASTATSAESPPSASVVKALASTTPLICGGATDVTLTLTGRAGEAGNATDIELVLDVSGSMAGTKITELKNAAKAFVTALDARDGAADDTLARSNRVGITTYRDESASTLSALGTNAASLVDAIDGITDTPTGGSPHAAGIIAAQEALGTGGAKKAIVLITDGLGNHDEAEDAADDAKDALVRIATIGIGSGDNALTGVDPAALQAWASEPGVDNYQAGSPGPIDANELVKDVGAAVAVPVDFTVVETKGEHFELSAPVPSAGTNATIVAGTLTWKGLLTGLPDVDLHATLAYHVTRDVADVFSVTSATVSTAALSVTDGAATISPANGVVSANLLPCGGVPLPQTCVGAACTASQGGVQFSVNAGTPLPPTDIFLTGFTQPPPLNVCPGFNSNNNGVQLDIRPLTTDGTFEIVIPLSVLQTIGKKWWQTEVCMGTNLRFITKLNSLANLRPGAKIRPGATASLPSRWWGLLPSIPRYTLLPNIGLVRGPWINHRSVRANGDAVIRFVVPYVNGSKPLTTDKEAAYDPKIWGGG